MKNATTIKMTIGISAITESIRTIMTSIKRSLTHSMHAWQFMWHPCDYAMVPITTTYHTASRTTERRLLVGVTGACCWHATSARAERSSKRS